MGEGLTIWEIVIVVLLLPVGFFLMKYTYRAPYEPFSLIDFISDLWDKLQTLCRRKKK